MSDDDAYIVVDGATGYLGTHLTQTMLKRGLGVHAIVHPHASRRDLEVLQSIGAQVTVGSFNQADGESPALERAFSGAIAAVHLIGSVAPKKGESPDELHAGQSHWFMYHAQKNGTGRVLAVTTLGAAEKAQTSYQRTKWAAEQIISSGTLPYTILQPALIIGKTVGNRDSKLVKRYREMIAKKMMVPVIGGGINKVEPIFVEDLVNAICKCIFPGKTQADVTGKVLQLGGPEVLEMRQFIRKLMTAMNVHKPIVPLPVPVAYASALICEACQEVPTVSIDQVKLSMSDNVCTDNALASILGIQPTPIEMALETYAKKKDAIAMGAKG